MPKVTVIMPSLNVAKYIKSCMESVIHQTLQDIEIIVVDAGSTDGTLEILQEYADKDSRLRIIHSDKKSYGYQLNIGISVAKGEYVGIVETDDLIELDMMEVLYNQAIEHNADFVKGTAKMFMEVFSGGIVEEEILCVPKPEWMNKILCPKNHPELFVTDRFLWMGIYRSDFIKSIRLNETPGAAFQDIGFMFQVIQKAEKAIYLNKNVYFYRQDNGNASSYDAKAFRYLETEYTYVKQFLQGKSDEWYQAYYEKLMNQSLGRFATMGMLGTFWDDFYQEMIVIQCWLKDAVKKGFLNEVRIGKERWKSLQCFLESPERIYEENCNLYREKIEVVLKLFEVIGKRNVVIFGSGKYGTFLHMLLETKRPGQVMAFCDNNLELWNMKRSGVKIISPQEAIKKYSDAIYVVANLKSADAIREQLKELGIRDERIYVYQQAPDMKIFYALHNQIVRG